jgi:hypothetical protein
MNAPTTTERPNDWAVHIRAAWRQTLDGIFETGARLIAARLDLEARGLSAQFARMVRSGELPFSESTASKLMTIAEAKERLLEVSHGKLPVAWSTLYQFALLDKEQLAAALEVGLFKGETERQEVERFKKHYVEEAPLPMTNADGAAAPARRARPATEAEQIDAMHLGAVGGLLAVDADVTYAELVRGDRGAGIVEPRKIALYLANTVFSISQTFIAALFNMDRTNVVKAVQDIERRRARDREFHTRLEALEARLKLFAEAAA